MNVNGSDEIHHFWSYSQRIAIVNFINTRRILCGIVIWLLRSVLSKITVHRYFTK